MPIKLRAPELSDATLLYIWENDPLVWRVGFNCQPLSLINIREMISTADPDIFKSGQLRLMICVDGCEAVGTVDLTDFDPRNRRAQVGIFISAQHRKKGYALQALKEIEIYARNILGCNQLWSMISDSNLVSEKLFKSAGFDCVATLPAWLFFDKVYHSARIYQKLL